MRKCLALLLLACAFPALSIAQTAAAPQYWQLTLEYDSKQIRIIDAQPFEAPAKEVRTPGAKGAPVRVDYDVQWLDSTGKSLQYATAEFPIGRRSAFHSDTGEEILLPASDVFVVRIAGPEPAANPVKVQLKRKQVIEHTARLKDAAAPLQFTEAMLDLPAIKPPPKVAGPISSTKVRDTGPDSNRLVIVVMGDGYTAANLAANSFTNHTNTLLTSFINKPPYNHYFNVTNVYRVDIESNQEGADEPSPGPNTFVDTYLNATFWTGNVERALAIDSTGRTRAFAAANALVGVGIWDDIFVLVNTTKYGGTGGSISVSSVNSAAPEIIIHEYGHTFAHLADEYDYGGLGIPSDTEPNVDKQFDLPNLKWNLWVDGGTPLPTPEATGTYATTVGAFEGAKYWTTGIYRPWDRCVMKELDRPFCPVCTEATVIEYANLLSLGDTLVPTNAAFTLVSANGTTFTATALNIAPITYEWRLNGNIIPGASGNSVTIMANELPLQTGTLSVKVAHPTTLVRKTALSDSYTWNIYRSLAAAEDWTLFE